MKKLVSIFKSVLVWLSGPDLDWQRFEELESKKYQMHGGFYERAKN